MKPEVYELCRSGLAALIRMGYDLMLAYIECKSCSAEAAADNLQAREKRSFDIYTSMVPMIPKDLK
jgi:hypothetical protein